MTALPEWELYLLAAGGLYSRVGRVFIADLAEPVEAAA